MKLGDPHEWRNGRFKNILKRQELFRCIPMHKKFQMPYTLDSERHDDDSENGRRIKDEVVVDIGAAECVTSRMRVSHVNVGEIPKSRRGETWTCAGGNKSRRKVK